MPGTQCSQCRLQNQSKTDEWLVSVIAALGSEECQVTAFTTQALNSGSGVLLNTHNTDTGQHDDIAYRLDT